MKTADSRTDCILTDFNYDSTDPAVQSILEGVAESGLTYSSYSGCSVSVGEGEAIVYGHDMTYSINSKAPAQDMKNRY